MSKPIKYRCGLRPQPPGPTALGLCPRALDPVNGVRSFKRYTVRRAGLCSRALAPVNVYSAARGRSSGVSARSGAVYRKLPRVTTRTRIAFAMLIYSALRRRISSAGSRVCEALASVGGAHIYTLLASTKPDMPVPPARGTVYLQAWHEHGIPCLPCASGPERGFAMRDID